MTPETFARAIVSIEQNYGLRLDARSAWLRLDATPCGKGWVGTKPGCKRKGKGDTLQPSVKVSKTTAPEIKAPETKPNESEVLKSTLQRLKAKLGESIAKGKKSEGEMDPTPQKEKLPPMAQNPGITENIPKSFPGIAKYKTGKVLGKGAFGSATMTDRGTVIKEAHEYSKASERTAKAEFEGLAQFHKLGIGPKPIGLEGVSIEMALVKGQSLGTLKKGVSDKEYQKKQMIAAKALLELHKSGWVHGDAHRENLVIDDNGKAQLLDAGFARKVGQEASDVTGVTDMYRSMADHPIFEKMNKALQPSLSNFSKKYRESGQMRPFSKGDLFLKEAALELHSAYLKIAPKFIK